MKPSVKQKAREWANPSSYGKILTNQEARLVYQAFYAGYEQGQYDLSQELATKLFKQFSDKYARRYDLADSGKSKKKQAKNTCKIHGNDYQPLCETCVYV